MSVRVEKPSDESGKLLVHEKNLVITEDGCELLTRRAPREMPVVPRA